MSQKDGGAAFPREDYQADSTLGQCGMSLRDYFAAQAIACFLHLTDDVIARPAEAAERAYRLADAMLKERAK